MANVLLETISTMKGQLEIEIWSDDLDHAIKGHPEVTIDKVKETLKDPSRVVQSKTSSSRCLFYSILIKTSETETLYFCVVVQVKDSGKGKMITAYDADYMKSGTELFSKEE